MSDLRIIRDRQVNLELEQEPLNLVVSGSQRSESPKASTERSSVNMDVDNVNPESSPNTKENHRVSAVAVNENIMDSQENKEVSSCFSLWPSPSAPSNPVYDGRSETSDEGDQKPPARSPSPPVFIWSPLMENGSAFLSDSKKEIDESEYKFVANRIVSVLKKEEAMKQRKIASCASNMEFNSAPIPGHTNSNRTRDAKNKKSPSCPEHLQLCWKCWQPADFACQGCYRVSYCCDDHQMKEWPSHRQACVHFSLDRHPSLVYRGPFYIENVSGTAYFPATAKADISDCNEKIFEEKPFLVCPWPKPRMHAFASGKFIPPGLIPRYLSCFGCGKALGFTHVRCRDCKLFLCSWDCVHISNHRKNECQIIQQLSKHQDQQGARVKEDPRLDLQKIYAGSQDYIFLYTDVMILRLLLKLYEMQKSLPAEKFQEEWYKLNMVWKSKPIGQQEKDLVMPRDLAFSYAATNGNLEFLWKLYCITKMNSLTLELPFRRFRALCIVLRTVKHSCNPNCHAYLKEPGVEKFDVDQIEENPDDLTVVLKAGKSIDKGEVLTVSYVPLTLGTFQRTLVLKEEYDISCSCNRCLDVTELGSYCTNVKCINCDHGLMIPTSSGVTSQDFMNVDSKAKWECRMITGIEPKQRFNQQISGGCTTQDSNTVFKRMITIEALIFELAKKEDPSACYMSMLEAYKFGQSTYGYYPVILRLCENLLRGNLLPLPDILADDLSEFEDEALALYLKARQIYGDFIRKFIPTFAFEGFPIANYELIENELKGRQRAHEMTKLTSTSRRSILARTRPRIRPTPVPPSSFGSALNAVLP